MALGGHQAGPCSRLTVTWLTVGRRCVVSRPELLTIKLFRTEPGDVGISDIFCSSDSITEAQRLTAEQLESASNDPQRKSQDKPTKAYLIGEDQQLIAEYRITPQGAEIVIRKGA